MKGKYQRKQEKKAHRKSHNNAEDNNGDEECKFLLYVIGISSLENVKG